MKVSKIKSVFITNIAMIILLGFSQIQAQTLKTVKTSTTDDSVSATQKKAIENIIRDYLLKNPSIIREASQALQLKEARERQELMASNLKKFDREIFFDPNSPTNGKAKAEVSVVAFFDYNCGYCKSSLPMLKQLVADDPSIRIVYKEYPILNQSSQLAAKAALAADRQGKYIEFHDALVGAAEINDNLIESISKQVGVNHETLKKDMNGEKINGYLANNYGLANALNIQGTPAYIVGTQVIPGAIDLDSLKKIVAQEKAKLVKPSNVAASSMAQ